MMKVAFLQFRLFGPSTRIGDVVVLEKTAHYLKELGIQIEFLDIWANDNDFDILHILGFNHTLSDYAIAAKKEGMKVVISPIATSRTPAWKWKAWGIVDKVMPVTTTYRFVRRLFEAADAILPGSRSESLFLHQAFAVPLEKMEVVYYGVDKDLKDLSPDLFLSRYGLQDFILMVARISRNKGQLRVLRAMQGVGIPLVFVGNPWPYEQEYFRLFQEECSKRPAVYYLGFVDEQTLRSAYAAAKVHILPGPGECPGLVSLEAGMAGANIVAAREPAVYEYLGDTATYCDPSSIRSIRDAILEAYDTHRDKRVQDRLLRAFTWESAAQNISKAYTRILAG